MLFDAHRPNSEGYLVNTEEILVPMKRVAEDEEEKAVAPLPKKTKGVKRSCYSYLKELIEEERRLVWSPWLVNYPAQTPIVLKLAIAVLKHIDERDYQSLLVEDMTELLEDGVTSMTKVDDSQISFYLYPFRDNSMSSAPDLSIQYSAGNKFKHYSVNFECEPEVTMIYRDLERTRRTLEQVLNENPRQTENLAAIIRTILDDFPCTYMCNEWCTVEHADYFEYGALLPARRRGVSQNDTDAQLGKIQIGPVFGKTIAFPSLKADRTAYSYLKELVEERKGLQVTTWVQQHMEDRLSSLEVAREVLQMYATREDKYLKHFIRAFTRAFLQTENEMAFTAMRFKLLPHPPNQKRPTILRPVYNLLTEQWECELDYESQDEMTAITLRNICGLLELHLNDLAQSPISRKRNLKLDFHALFSLYPCTIYTVNVNKNVDDERNICAGLLLPGFHRGPAQGTQKNDSFNEIKDDPTFGRYFLYD